MFNMYRTICTLNRPFCQGLTTHTRWISVLSFHCKSIMSQKIQVEVKNCTYMYYAISLFKVKECCFHYFVIKFSHNLRRGFSLTTLVRRQVKVNSTCPFSWSVSIVNVHTHTQEENKITSLSDYIALYLSLFNIFANSI